MFCDWLFDHASFLSKIMKIESQIFQQSYLNEIVNSFEVEEVVVRHVDADTEVESGVTAIDYFVIPELDKVGVLGIAH
jgi:hypothetical protein